jgi:hypothetical protein
MNYRIVICVDIEADSLTLAYGKLHDFMGTVPTDVEWESTDEWFDDEDGEPGDPDAMQKARMKFFADRCL